MAIKVLCKSCGKTLNAPTNAAGRVLSCPGCKGEIRVPSLLDDESAVGINPDGLWDTISQELPELTSAPAAVALAPAPNRRNQKPPVTQRLFRDPLLIGAGLLLCRSAFQNQPGIGAS